LCIFLNLFDKFIVVYYVKCPDAQAAISEFAADNKSPYVKLTDGEENVLLSIVSVETKLPGGESIVPPPNAAVIADEHEPCLDLGVSKSANDDELPGDEVDTCSISMI